VPIDVEVAIGEIAARLQDIRTAHGNDAAAQFVGTLAALASLAMPFAAAWWATMRSHKTFSTPGATLKGSVVVETRGEQR
jgi:hypothetical protein